MFTRSRVLPSLFAAGFLALIVAAQPAKAPKKTILDGIYTPEQAARGKALYTQQCAECHEGAAFDGTPLEGALLINNWREDTIEPLFDYIQEFMPQTAPKSLDDAQVRDILSYILQMNQYPAGKQELTQQGVETIWFVGPDGPQPLPTTALIQTIGCFATGPDSTWVLEKTSPAVRTREGDHATPEEIKRAQHRELGDETFKLNNLDYMPGFKPDAYKGKKVLVKGVMLRSGGNNRINVTGIDTLAPSCP